MRDTGPREYIQNWLPNTSCRRHPVISVSVNRGEITVSDNGPGLKLGTVADILDYTVTASSREAYVSPTRGAQGNALKTIVAMPFALDGTKAST